MSELYNDAAAPPQLGSEPAPMTPDQASGAQAFETPGASGVAEAAPASAGSEPAPASAAFEPAPSTPAAGPPQPLPEPDTAPGFQAAAEPVSAPEAPSAPAAPNETDAPATASQAAGGDRRGPRPERGPRHEAAQGGQPRAQGQGRGRQGGGHRQGGQPRGQGAQAAQGAQGTQGAQAGRGDRQKHSDQVAYKPEQILQRMQNRPGVYRAYLHEAEALLYQIRLVGLGPALAVLLSQTEHKSKRRIYWDISKWVFKEQRIKGKNVRSLMESIVYGDPRFLLKATHSVVNFLEDLVRLSQQVAYQPHANPKPGASSHD